MTNAKNPADKQRSELLADRNDADLRWVLRDPRGRRFIWRELGRCGLHTQTYDPNNSHHCFRAGERNSALRLYADVLRVSSEDYLTMQREAIADDKMNAINEEVDRDDD